MRSHFWFPVVLSLSVSQAALAGKCEYSLSQASLVVAAAGTNTSFSVTATDGCGWAAVTTNDWISTTSAGTGSGPVLCSVSPNLSGLARSGAIKVESRTIVITQEGLTPDLAGALNDPQLLWTTGPDYPWFVSSNPTFDGVYCAASGNKNVHDSVSWLETTLIGPGRLSFWWKVDGDLSTISPDEPPYSFDSLQIVVNDVLLDEIMGQVDWCYRSFDIPEGTNTVRWQYAKDAQYHWAADRGWVDRVRFSTNPPIPLARALNTRGVLWTSGGNTNATEWQSQAEISHDGALSARSGEITGNQESWLQAAVPGATNVSFWWRISSEAGYDWLEFYIDEELAARISGETGWEFRNFALPSTQSTLRWRYVKNPLDFFAEGQDCGWLDEVVLLPVRPVAPFRLQPPVFDEEGKAQIRVEGDPGSPCRVQVSTDLTRWDDLAEFYTSGASETVMDPGAASGGARFYRAISD